uniref:CD82 molecule b n=1 Tax=Fundulus heteroclitus TaxID=8078 RepID=A0A3Q2P6E6_FUNHE
MGKGCITVTKYFLFLFNLLFFIFGAVIMGFGLWVLLDKESFIAVLQESSNTMKVASYILIGVGSLTMSMGFFGCIGAIYEIRCLLGLYFTCLLLILIAQVTAGVLIYFQRDLVRDTLYFFPPMKCCGWTSPGNWSENLLIKNSTQKLYSCSCRNDSLPGTDVKEFGLCDSLSPQPPVYETGCITSVERWLLDNCAILLGICVCVAVVEVGYVFLLCSDVSYHAQCFVKKKKKKHWTFPHFIRILCGR